MTLIPTLMLACTMLAPDGPSNALEFSGLMKELHGGVSSVCFIYEGEMTRLESNGQPKSARSSMVFQGLYALRPGTRQAGLLEIYEGITPDPPTHRSMTILDSTFEDSNIPSLNHLGIDAKTRKPKTSHGSPGSLNIPRSTERINFLWYFSAFVFHDYPDMMFENLGWENVGDHKCLKVKLGSGPGSKPSKTHKIFWIDLERGGHPLKVESYYDGRMLSRVSGISLEKVADVKGKFFWLPLQGQVDVYGAAGSEIHDYPISHETIGVVLGSIQLNLDLPDSAFVVHTKPRTELANAVSLKQSHPIEAARPVVERPKTDPASVKARLDAKLAEADKQAAEVKASSPARESWSSTTIAQIIVGVVGIAMIATALVWRWRQS